VKTKKTLQFRQSNVPRTQHVKEKMWNWFRLQKTIRRF